MNKAVTCAESYLNAIKAGDLKTADTFYSNMYNDTESKEKRMEKMQKLMDGMGKIESFTLTDSVKKKSGDDRIIELTYKVKHTRLATIEKYTIMKDEGNYKIVSQMVENDK